MFSITGATHWAFLQLRLLVGWVERSEADPPLAAFNLPKQPAPPGFFKPDPGLYGPDDSVEHVVGNILIGLERDVAAVGISKRRARFNPICHLVDDAHVLEHRVEVRVKVAT